VVAGACLWQPDDVGTSLELRKKSFSKKNLTTERPGSEGTWGEDMGKSIKGLRTRENAKSPYSKR